MSYQCNITGQSFDLEENEKDREGGVRFGFNCRFRAICYVLCKCLYGECRVLKNLPDHQPITGIGMSDSGWAAILAQKFHYTNTFYHQPPFLDICQDSHVEQYRALDFIVSSDVFEHVDPHPSLQRAFDNLAKMLKVGGSLVFSVPYTFGEHVEHFPRLYDYRISLEDNEYVLRNRTIDGEVEEFRNLCFHGGPGHVLEMRVFSKKSVTAFLENAGFVNITFHEVDADMEQCGIFWSRNSANSCSLIISAQKGVDTSVHL